MALVLFACAPSHPSELQASGDQAPNRTIAIQNAALPVCSATQADGASAVKCHLPELHLQLLVHGTEDLAMADFEAQVTALGAKVVGRYEASIPGSSGLHLHTLSVSTLANDGDDPGLCQRFVTAFNHAPYSSLVCYYALGSPITGSAGVHN